MEISQIMIGRRAFIGVGALALGTAVASQRFDYASSLVRIARTSTESRWYPWTISLDRSLRTAFDRWSPATAAAGPNVHLLDLSDIENFSQLRLVRRQRLIERTQGWELSAENPASRNDVGYPSLVWGGADGDKSQYHLFYAIHDPDSGIGLARASDIYGPYTKFRGQSIERDSRVIFAPARPRATSHLSSPVVLWNAQRKLWHMYFHYYSNQFDDGFGHQNTALATSRNLVDWDVLTGHDGDFLAVLPVTPELWMNSQSTYHTVQRLPNGLWLAFLRGTGIRKTGSTMEEQPTAMGLAASLDGIRWSLVPGAPQWPALPQQVEGRVIQRPGFVARMRGGFALVWAHQPQRGPEKRFAAFTRDFAEFRQMELPDWGMSIEDGAISAVRKGQEVVMITGPYAYGFAIDR